MKLWILGGSGLLGSVLKKICEERGIDIIATDRQEADVANFESLRSAAKNLSFTHMINCTAYTDVDGAEREQKLAYRVNRDGPKHLGMIAASTKTNIIHISTDYVFEGVGNTPYKEEDACNPVGIYGKSKREGELKVLEEFPSACIIRTSWLFGLKGKNFISSLMSLMEKKEELQVVSDQRGRPTYVKDLAEAILALLPHSGIFHFANTGDRSRFEIACDIFEEATKQGIKLKCQKISPVSSEYFPSLAKRPPYSVLCTKKYEETVNSVPRNWKTVLEEYIRNAAKSS